VLLCPDGTLRSRGPAKSWGTFISQDTVKSPGSPDPRLLSDYFAVTSDPGIVLGNYQLLGYWKMLGQFTIPAGLLGSKVLLSDPSVLSDLFFIAGCSVYFLNTVLACSENNHFKSHIRQGPCR
jgi:hypothetical protein